MAARNKPGGGHGQEKIWRNAVTIAVHELREADGEGKARKVRALRLLARKLVSKALGGDVAAMKEIGDRLDGKAVQGVEVDGTVTVTSIERTIIDAGTEAAEGGRDDAEAKETVH